MRSEGMVRAAKQPQVVGRVVATVSPRDDVIKLKREPRGAARAVCERVRAPATVSMPDLAFRGLGDVARFGGDEFGWGCEVGWKRELIRCAI
jgi:hypothetical protein